MTSGLGGTSFDDDFVPPAEPDLPEDTGGGGLPVQAFKDAAPRRHKERNKRDPAPSFGEYRQPPHDREAEQGVLGAMLLSPNTVVEIVGELSPEDFYHPAHQLIYTAMIDLFGESKDIDPVIVAGRLDRRNDLERVGGAPYLHTLISSVPTAANARYYAEIVSEKAILRRLVAAGTRVVQLGYEGNEGAEVETVLDMA